MTAVSVGVRPAGVAPARGRNRALTLRRQLTNGVIVFAMSSLPLLRPAGPGNTGLADVGLVIAVLVSAVWLSGRGHRLQMPYLWPTMLIIAAGSLAALHAAGDPLALLQDAFVFAWAVSAVNLARDPAALRVLVRAWAFSGVLWASALIVGVSVGIPWLAGQTARDGIRASFTLGDPNLAASYFLCALLVLRACQEPRRRAVRYLCCTIIVVALVLTLSNGGMLTLVVATEMGWIFGLGRRRGLAPAVAVACILIAVTAVGALTINVNTMADKAQQSTPLLRDSIGRQGESGGSRSTLIHDELTIWFTRDTVLGIGPGETKVLLARGDASYTKEAHNDYLASLVERGVLGALGLIALIASLAVKARRIARPGALPPAYAAVIPRPELLGALLVAVAVSAGLYETLHFRHVWALFGLVAALAIAARQGSGTHPEPEADPVATS